MLLGSLVYLNCSCSTVHCSRSVYASGYRRNFKSSTSCQRASSMAQFAGSNPFVAHCTLSNTAAESPARGRKRCASIMLEPPLWLRLSLASHARVTRSAHSMCQRGVQARLPSDKRPRPSRTSVTSVYINVHPCKRPRPSRVSAISMCMQSRISMLSRRSVHQTQPTRQGLALTRGR